jgi:hypothetical protein
MWENTDFCAVCNEQVLAVKAIHMLLCKRANEAVGLLCVALKSDFPGVALKSDFSGLLNLWIAQRKVRGGSGSDNGVLS